MIHAIVADARRLRIFEAAPDRLPIELAVFANPSGGKRERDLVSDRAGRVVNTASGARQALQSHSPAAKHALQSWLKDIAPSVRDMLKARTSTGLILFASPRLLPMLRGCLAESVLRSVLREVALDLASQPSSTLRRRIDPTLRIAAKQLAKPELTYRWQQGRKRAAASATL